MDIVSPVLEYLERLHAKFAALDEGDVATYIPELARADKRLFGVCLTTIDGQVYEVGDTRHPFTIQSISKPLVYATALTDHGAEAMFRKVGVEPSGDAFNAISLDSQTGRPANPMINAGAIASAALLLGDTPEEKLRYMLDAFARYAGHPLEIDEAVYASERDTGFRNQAIAFLLRNFGILENDPAAIVDLYFRQCSVLVNCRDLSVMAGTLANAGVNPLTGIRALGESQVESALSVMGSCGMYDYAGEWTFTVGLPAKSGVSGGILAVLPGHLGIGVYSPALDSHGNSVRGIAICHELSRNFGLHIFRVPRANRSVIHRAYTADLVPSNRARSPRDKEALQTMGRRIRVYELQGELSFGTVEVVVRDVLQDADSRDFILLDFARVSDMNAIAGELLSSLALRLWEGNRRLLFTSCRPAITQAFTNPLRARNQDEEAPFPSEFPDTDHALEWCENKLLSSHSDESLADGAAKTPAPFEAFELLRGLTDVETEALRRILGVLTFQTGNIIIQEGEIGDAIYLLTRGEVSVRIRQRSGGEKRLATFSAGMCFGEMALLEPFVRSATVYADSPAECWELKKDDLERLWEERPRIRAVMMENLAFDLSRKLRRTNVLIGALSQ